MKKITGRKKRLYTRIMLRKENISSDKTAFINGMFSILDVSGSEYINHEPVIRFKKRPSRVNKVLTGRLLSSN